MKKKYAKLSNIESHDKCYNLLPNIISKCLSLNIKINYVIPRNNGFKIISIGNDYLNLLENLRKESNEQTCHGFEKRMDDIKKKMHNRRAPKEQIDELSKIEGIYCSIQEELKYEK